MLQHQYARMSAPMFWCMVNNNEAVWLQRQADRSDAASGGISHVATTSHIQACYITLQSPACLCI